MHTNTWKAGNDLMKSNYLTKNTFIAVEKWKKLKMLIIDMQKEYTKNCLKSLYEYHDLYVQSDTFC